MPSLPQKNVQFRRTGKHINKLGPQSDIAALISVQRKASMASLDRRLKKQVVYLGQLLNACPFEYFKLYLNQIETL